MYSRTRARTARHPSSEEGSDRCYRSRRGPPGTEVKNINFNSAVSSSSFSSLKLFQSVKISWTINIIVIRFVPTIPGLSHFNHWNDLLADNITLICCCVFVSVGLWCDMHSFFYKNNRQAKLLSYI